MSEKSIKSTVVQHLCKSFPHSHTDWRHRDPLCRNLLICKFIASRRTCYYGWKILESAEGLFINLIIYQQSFSFTKFLNYLNWIKLFFKIKRCLNSNQLKFCFIYYTHEIFFISLSIIAESRIYLTIYLYLFLQQQISIVSSVMNNAFNIFKSAEELLSRGHEVVGVYYSSAKVQPDLFIHK